MPRKFGGKWGTEVAYWEFQIPVSNYIVISRLALKEEL